MDYGSFFGRGKDASPGPFPESGAAARDFR
jgi:hypothetical protein